jgi:hypothetical protein
MNIEFSKIKSPFQSDRNHMSELALRIQRKVGLDAQEVFEYPELKEPLIPRNPVQLSVEFGNSYVSESPEKTFIESPEIKNVEPVVAEPTNQSWDVPSIEFKTIPQEIEIHTEPETTQSIPAPMEEEEVVLSAEEIALEKSRSAEVERKRAEAAARYAALVDESRSDYIAPTTQKDSKSESQLPWAAILGLVASIAAIATAWWVWSVIQAPITIEQVAENSRRNVSDALPIAVSVVPEETGLLTESLPFDSQLIVEMMDEGEAVSPVTPMTHFSKMNDQSKISMVELENNGLLIMDLEDQFFEETQL